MRYPDALALANQLDEAWHDQPRSFEREAIARFWGLLTLPARALNPTSPRRLLREAVVLRNARFRGEAVRAMFFGNKEYTEVDAVFFSVGSGLGHSGGDEVWVVEVERKAAHGQGDYYIAIRRARAFADLLARQFRLRPRAVVIYEDDNGRFSAQDFDGGVLLVRMGALRDLTSGLRFPSISDLPGVACDKTLVKILLLKALSGSDPNHPEGYSGALALSRGLRAAGGDLHLPVVGHQDTDRLPDNLEQWLQTERESDEHLSLRLERSLDELYAQGALDQRVPAPRLSIAGGQAVLQLLRAESEASV